jgi:hypothetical protein
LNWKLQRLRVPHFVYQTIAQSTRGTPCEDSREPSVLVCSSMQGLAIVPGNGRFRTPKKCRADLHTGRTKRKRGSYTATIRDATGGDHGNAYGVHHLRNESHRPDQPGTAAEVKVPRCPPASKP